MACGGANNKIRLIIRRAYDFHSPGAALTTVVLACGPVNLLPHPHRPQVGQLGLAVASRYVRTRRMRCSQ
ncbi:MAG: hypothetical protein M3Y48_03335 [Actinomycetota bacterium]|nr:hypothetical protein [Actinomycetota bacterium]